MLRKLSVTSRQTGVHPFSLGVEALSRPQLISQPSDSTDSNACYVFSYTHAYLYIIFNLQLLNTVKDKPLITIYCKKIASTASFCDLEVLVGNIA